MRFLEIGKQPWPFWSEVRVALSLYSRDDTSIYRSNRLQLSPDKKIFRILNLLKVERKSESSLTTRLARLHNRKGTAKRAMEKHFRRQNLLQVEGGLFSWGFVAVKKVKVRVFARHRDWSAISIDIGSVLAIKCANLHLFEAPCTA